VEHERVIETVGPYQLQEEIARGGMGVVHRGLGPQGPVAVKLLLEGQHDPRFERELEAQRRLDHPGIVRVLDGGRDPRGRAFMVQELVTGGSLADRLKREGALPSPAVVELGVQLCRALEAAHGQGVLHRDLKPANVLLDAQGQAKLTDFGLAKVVDQRESLTRTGQLMGTPAFMSPEQASGEKELIGPHSDVYGLGATLYTLLTGQPPFQHDSALSLVVAVLRDPPPAPSRLVAGVPADLERILLRCLSKDVGDRYSTVSALRAELASLGQRPASKNHAPALALAILLAGGAGAAFVLVRAGRDAPTAPATATEKPAGEPASDPDYERGEATLRALLDIQDRLFSGDVRHGSPEESQVLTNAHHTCLDAPDLAPWLTAKGHLNIRGDAPLTAEALLERATELEPDRAYAWTKLGQARVLAAPGSVASELDAAREALERALALDPDQPLALLYLAKIEWASAPERALARLGRALELRPRWWPLYRQRAQLRAAMEDLPGALEDCQRALELAPRPAGPAL
jgi:tetratricopeptide (TPR) repeat protein